MATLVIGIDYKPSPDVVVVKSTDGCLTIVVPPGGCELVMDTVGGCPELALSLKDDIVIDFGAFFKAPSKSITLKYSVIPYGSETRRKKRVLLGAHSIQVGD